MAVQRARIPATPRPTALDWCCVAAVNSPETLRENLAASPALESARVRLRVQENAPCAGVAYNRGLAESSAPIVVFAHQDVYLPGGWDTRLLHQLAQLYAVDPDWAVAGVAGMGPDGRYHGRLWSTGLGREIGTAFETPVPAVSLDEVVLVLRRDSGLHFDEALPGFHLYGTDIVQSALAAGKGAYVLNAPVVHNSRPVRDLSGAFSDAYGYMRQKWASELPIRTPVTRITRDGEALARTRARVASGRLRKTARRLLGLARVAPGALLGKPAARRIAHKLGYEKE